MMSVPAGGAVSRGTGEIGVTGVREKGMEAVEVPCVDANLLDVAFVRTTLMEPVVAPGSRPAGLIVSCTVVPPAESAPEAGNTVIQGTSVVMTKVSLFVAVSPKPGTR